MKNTMALRRAPGGEVVARLCPTKWRSRDAFADFWAICEVGASWHCSRSGKHSSRVWTCVKKQWSYEMLWIYGGIIGIIIFFCFKHTWGYYTGFGGLEHDFVFPYIGNFIIPTDELIFFRRVGQPPTSTWYDQQHGIWMVSDVRCGELSRKSSISGVLMICIVYCRLYIYIYPNIWVSQTTCQHV